MQNFQVVVKHEDGLHARPATLFVKAASGCASQVRVRNLTTGSKWIDARSILNVLTLGVEPGQEIDVEVIGSDEENVAAQLLHLVDSDFEVE